MDAREAGLMAAMTRLTSDPGWRRAQDEEGPKKLADFTRRPLASVRINEDLPAVTPSRRPGN